MTANEDLFIPKINMGPNGDLIILPSATSSNKDFDFYQGKWSLINKKLKTKLNKCLEWTEFRST